MKLLLQLSQPLRNWSKYVATSNHLCACMKSQCRLASNKTTDQRPSLKSNVKHRKTIEFSKSKSYPTQMPLHGMEEMNADSMVETPKDRIKRVMAMAAMLAITCLAGYAFFFSTYDVDFEEKMANTVPEYVDYMKKADPNYEETIKKLKEKRSRHNAMKHQIE